MWIIRFNWDCAVFGGGAEFDSRSALCCVFACSAYISVAAIRILQLSSLCPTIVCLSAMPRDEPRLRPKTAGFDCSLPGGLWVEEKRR